MESITYPTATWTTPLTNLQHLYFQNHIGDVMATVFASSAVYRGFKTKSSQTKDYKIGICCFSANHAALRRKKKDWLVRNQDNVSKWGDMSIRRLLFQWARTIIISLKISLFSSWYSWNIGCWRWTTITYSLILSNRHVL